MRACAVLTRRLCLSGARVAQCPDTVVAIYKEAQGVHVGVFAACSCVHQLVLPRLDVESWQRLLHILHFLRLMAHMH